MYHGFTDGCHVRSKSNAYIFCVKPQFAVTSSSITFQGFKKACGYFYYFGSVGRAPLFRLPTLDRVPLST